MATEKLTKREHVLLDMAASRYVTELIREMEIVRHYGGDIAPVQDRMNEFALAWRRLHDFAESA